jgi:hypothetical protein
MYYLILVLQQLSEALSTMHSWFAEALATLGTLILSGF